MDPAACLVPVFFLMFLKRAISMSLKLDHIVIAVHDLDATVLDYRALGFNVLIGGDHPGRTSHNALIVFADGVYFELIAWKSPAPQERWWQLLQQHGEGLVDFALLPDSTASTVAAAAERGLVLAGPLDGGRVRPDGERLHWQTARPTSADLPFLCGDLTPRALRVPEGEARVHPNGVQGVTSLAVAVQDLEATLGRYRALLGTSIGEAVVEPSSNERVARVALGDNLLLLSSLQKPGTQETALAQRLAAHGEGPYQVQLKTSQAALAGSLDLKRTHGAAVELAGL
jgi:catechol 2,3-dioxygenase-like lactoylglutathione lyase family enzyme